MGDMYILHICTRYVFVLILRRIGKNKSQARTTLPSLEYVPCVKSTRRNRRVCLFFVLDIGSHLVRLQPLVRQARS